MAFICSRRSLLFGFGCGLALPKFSFGQNVERSSSYNYVPTLDQTQGELLPTLSQVGHGNSLPSSDRSYWSLGILAPNVRSVKNIIYRAGDVYSNIALRQLSYMMRDYHNEVSCSIDPKLFDILSWIQQASGDEPIILTSGYRTPRTESLIYPSDPSMSHRSPHVHGQAADIRIHGIDCAWIRDAGHYLGVGGVGFYPKSKFVHLDSGPSRSWTGV